MAEWRSGRVAEWQSGRVCERYAIGMKNSVKRGRRTMFRLSCSLALAASAGIGLAGCCHLKDHSSTYGTLIEQPAMLARSAEFAMVERQIGCGSGVEYAVVDRTRDFDVSERIVAEDVDASLLIGQRVIGEGRPTITQVQRYAMHLIVAYELADGRLIEASMGPEFWTEEFWLAYHGEDKAR